MAEHLAGAKQIEHTAVVDDLDGAGAHNPHVLDRTRTLLEDLRGRRMELDLRRLGHTFDVGEVERVERRMEREELSDVLQRARYISP